MSLSNIHIPFIPNKTGDANNAAAYKMTLKKGTKELLDKAMDDELLATGASKNAQMTSAIYRSLIPGNAEAEYYIVLLYENMDLAEPLAAFFESESAGIGFASFHQCNQPMFKFAYRVLARCKTSFWGCVKAEAIHDAYYAWSNVCEYFKNEIGKSTNWQLLQDLDYANWIKTAIESESDLLLSDVLDFILREWGYLGTYTYVYRFLASVFGNAELKEITPKERIQFKETCAEVCYWHESEDRKGALSDKKQVDSCTYYLANGNSVAVPGSYIVLNHSMPVSSRVCACAIETRNASPLRRRNGVERVEPVPAFVFFLDHSFAEFGEKDEQQIIAAAISAYPRFKEIVEAQVPIEYASNGKPLNYDEHCAAPIVGFFEVPVIS